MKIINKVLAKFCSITPIQEFTNKIQSTKYATLCDYMNKNNQSIGIKGMAKTIFALKREIENQS